MHIKDALETPGTCARIISLDHIQGLSNFPVNPISSQETPAVECVIRNYVRLLRYVEQRLEHEARERATDRMPPRLVFAMLRNELCPSSYATLRIYGDWVLQEVRSFGSSISIAANASTGQSTAERLKFGLKRHCELSVDAVEAKVRELRASNATAFHADEKFDEGEEVFNGFQNWRLSATTVVTALIELSSIRLSPDENTVLWRSLTGNDGNWLISNIQILECGES